MTIWKPPCESGIWAGRLDQTHSHARQILPDQHRTGSDERIAHNGEADDSSGWVLHMRFIADTSNWDHSLMNMTLGQSGQVLSPHYSDQWEEYYTGRSF